MRISLVILFCYLFISFSAGQSADHSILIHKVDGKEIAYPRLSKDGSRILYQSNQNGPWELFIMDIEKGIHEKVKTGGTNDNFPDWSADNNWISFVSDRSGNEEIYLMKSDGSELQQITKDPARDIHPYFSPDGKYILFNSTRGNQSFDQYRYTIATKKTERLTDTPEDETCGRYSPDMNLIVLLKNGPAYDDVFIMDAKTNELKNLSNTPLIRDGWPMFSYDNQWVYYSSMSGGSYSIYRILLDGSQNTKLTTSGGYEDARVSVARDGNWFIYNKRVGNSIEIRKLHLG